MLLTYGYIREATQAHIDLDEQETQAMHLQERYHIYANEAMVAICATKPKYDYFKVKAVKEYKPLINLGNNTFREATEDEVNWETLGTPEPNFADDTDTKKWYEGQNIFLLNTQVRMPDDFVAFANKIAWAFIIYNRFSSEKFVKGSWTPSDVESIRRIQATKDMFIYTGRNTLTFLLEGEYHIPYKGIWYKFKSGMKDHEEIDMPFDILTTIPLYVAAQCLQIDHAQKAAAKRAEFETMLARVNNTDFLETPKIVPSFK